MLFPRRLTALAASCLHLDMVGKSGLFGKHMLVKPGFFSLSRSSATSVSFNLHGDLPNHEFPRHAACHESIKGTPGIRIRNRLSVRHDGNPHTHGVCDMSRRLDHVMDRPALDLASSLIVLTACIRQRRTAVSRKLADHVAVQDIPHCRGPEGCGCLPPHRHPQGRSNAVLKRTRLSSRCHNSYKIDHKKTIYRKFS